MKPKSRVLAGVAVFALVTTMSRAQTPPPGPFQQVTEAEFKQLVQSGQVVVTGPKVQSEQNQQAQLAETQNLAVVDAFIKQHPNLTALAALANSVPSGQDIVPTTGGDYLWQITDALGEPDTVQTMGPATILRDLAVSIQASQDAAQQLALYQSLYSQYAIVYNEHCPATGPNSGGSKVCASLTLPSALPDPSTLPGASLQTIKDAIQALVSQGPKLINLVPPLFEGGPFASCSTDIGASSTATNVLYGDQTRNTCTALAPSGILANFTWQNENLLTCVKKQGFRGTCHIFAATSAMEELIARDTGTYVNLSEQDFEESEKLLWNPNFYADGGSAGRDLNNAQTFSYQFAYENQWDYNPSYSQPTCSGCYEYVNTCENYPSTEPGCSDDAPQAPEVCYELVHGWVCGFYTTATLSGPRSPYMSDGVMSIWDPASTTTTFNSILTVLAENDAVTLSFGVTENFNNATANAGYVKCPAPCTVAGNPDLTNVKGGHVVHLVGYIDNTTLAGSAATAAATPGEGGGYFIIKNSWDTCNGDDGYYYMPVDYLMAMATGLNAVASESH